MDNLLHILLLLSPSIIYYTAKKPIETNYKLRKDFKLKGVNTSVLPTEVLRKVNDIDEKKLLELQFAPSIIEFINKIKQNISDSDLTLFYNNFNNVKTSVKNFKILNFGEYIGAQWVPLKNVIELSPDNYKSTINHELFHVSTTYIDSNTNVIFCGFSQFQIKNGNKRIGDGLNEGYTQYLTDKYFSSEPLVIAYPYEKRIAEIVELIVGQEKMQSLYFNANLKGLIDVLKQYSTEKNVYNFITTIDFLNKHLTDKKLTPNSNEIRLDSLKSINSFLIQTYINKIILEHPNKKIDTKEIIDKLVPLLTLLPSDVAIHGKSVNVNDGELMIKIINDAFSGYELSEDRKTISR